MRKKHETGEDPPLRHHGPKPDHGPAMLLGTLSLLVAALFLVQAVQSNASWHANAVLLAVVIGSEGPAEPVADQPFVQVPARLFVIRCLSGGGHDPGLGEQLVGTFQGPLQILCRIGEEERIVPGALLRLRWRCRNSLGIDKQSGRALVEAGESWTLDNP